MPDSSDWIGRMRRIDKDSPLVKEGVQVLAKALDTFQLRFTPMSSTSNRAVATRLWNEQVVPIFGRAIDEINYLEIVKNRGLTNALRHQALASAEDKLKHAEGECRNASTQSRLSSLGAGSEDQVRRLRVELWGHLLGWDKASLSSD